MYHRRYDKVFLMLRQETAGYALAKRPPWGSCVMELKNGTGRLQLSVQGLRPIRGGYEVYVLAGEESIFCGSLQPDAKEGHAELKWDFSPDAMGQGKQAEDLHTVLVLAEYGKNGYSAPLTAFFGEKRDWRAIFAPQRDTREQTEEITLQAAEAVAPLRVTAPQNTNAAVAEGQKESCHGSFRGLLARFRRELAELEETGVLSPQETERIRQVGAKPPQEAMETSQETAVEASQEISQEAQNETAAEVPQEMPADALQEIQAEISQETQTPQEQTDSIFGTKRILQPFGDGVDWKCIAPEELTLLAQIPLRWQKEFFFLLPCRRYHHLIAQEREDGVWLGLPGSYSEQDAAQGRAFGFGEFRAVDADWGYWLCFLEKQN